MHKINEIIEFENESHRVDFKTTEYSLGKVANKNEILKDFLAFVNHPSDEDKFIICGITENDDKTKRIIEINNPTDDANYQQFLSANVEPQINFEYRNIEHNGKRISYFRLFNNINRPYLLKKDINNPKTGKIDFKYGDGFIRVGTSTKKIGRKELDEIYQKKANYINRKNDIEIVPITGESSADGISQLKLLYLDIIIFNKSNKSIDLDIEIKFQKSTEYKMMLESDLLNEIENYNRDSKGKNSILPTVPLTIPHLPNLHINAQETDTEFIVSRNPIKNKTAITLPQGSKEEDVFCQSILLINNNSDNIKAEIIIRSDDFNDGAIIKELTFEIKNIR